MQFIKHLILIILVSSIFAVQRVEKTEKKTLRTNTKTATKTTAKTTAKTTYSRGEEPSNIAFNGNWWNQNVKIYLSQIDKPTSAVDQRGIVFSSNYGRKNFVQVSNYNGKTVHYLPYRNLNKIVCNAYGTNRCVFSDGTTTYDVWVDVWESECNTICNNFDTNRRNRQSVLANAVKDLAKLANEYVTNINTYEGLISGGSTLQSRVQDLKNELNTCNGDITTNTNTQTTLTNNINTENSVLSGLTSRSTQLQSQIDSNTDQTEKLNGSIKDLSGKQAGQGIKKDEYTQKANVALNLFNNLLGQLNAENVQGDANYFKGLPDKLKAFDTEGVKGVINGFIPN